MGICEGIGNMSGRLGPGGVTGVVVTAGAAGAGAAGTGAGNVTGPCVGTGAVACGGVAGAAEGSDCGAAGGSACGAVERWEPTGTGGFGFGDIVGGTMGVATFAGGIGVVVGKGICCRWPCASGGGMIATPDGTDGSVDGNSNLGGSCVEGLC